MIICYVRGEQLDKLCFSASDLIRYWKNENLSIHATFMYLLCLSRIKTLELECELYRMKCIWKSNGLHWNDTKLHLFVFRKRFFICAYLRWCLIRSGDIRLETFHVPRNRSNSTQYHINSINEYAIICNRPYVFIAISHVSSASYSVWSTARGPFNQHGFNLIPTWIRNHKARECEWWFITYPFPNINNDTVEVWE